MEERTINQVEKAWLAETIDHAGISGYRAPASKYDRGLDIYNLTEIQGVTGRAQSGREIHGTIQRPVYALSVIDRIEMFKRSTMLQGVVTSRSKRMSALKWKIVRKTVDHKRLLAEMKEMKELYDEYDDYSLKSMTVRAQAAQYLAKHLPDLKPDLSNYDAALRRYKKRYERKNEDVATEIENWLKRPSKGVSFADFREQYTIDLMVHGGASIYKEYRENMIANFYMLPGGSIYPYRGTHVGGPEIYFQIIPTFEPRAYFSNELSYIRYLPTSWQTNGEVPLEALINKVAESILFDKRSADQADGTKPPEKAIAFGKEPAPLGGLTDNLFDLPMDKNEQKRIETKLNEARKEAIVTISGYGHPAVIDLSKADTFAFQQARQDKLLRDVALIFNMTNMEVNLAGGEFANGRETSEVQKEIEQEKGIGPILKKFQDFINDDILPYRYGYDYEFQFDVGMSDKEQVELEQRKIQTGTYSVNQIREERGDDVYPEEQYNRPQGATVTAPDGSQANPFNMTGEVRTV